MNIPRAFLRAIPLAGVALASLTLTSCATYVADGYVGGYGPSYYAPPVGLYVGSHAHYGYRSYHYPRYRGHYHGRGHYYHRGGGHYHGGHGHGGNHHRHR